MTIAVFIDLAVHITYKQYVGGSAGHGTFWPGQNLSHRPGFPAEKNKDP